MSAPRDPDPGRPATDRGARRFLLQVLLGLLCLAATARLATFTARFASEGLQMDFSAFYTAGQSAALGLSPYANHIERTPPVWDGAALYRHSRFLYPPIVAEAFRPIAALPYLAAKWLWSLLSLACLGVALAVASRAFPRGRAGTLAVLSAAALFYPLLAHLERGQIDLLVLALVMLMVRALARRTAGGDRLAGLLLAGAVVLKLHCVYLFPLLIPLRRWRAAAYCAVGLACALLTSVAPPLLRSETVDYVATELPRASEYGEAGPDEWMTHRDEAALATAGLAPGHTRKDGHAYRVSWFPFTANASLVRAAVPLLERRGVRWSIPALSLACFGLLLVPIWWVGRLVREDGGLPVSLLYWQLGLTAVLLSAPLSWVMSTVWVVPSIPGVLHAAGRVSDRRQAFGIAVAVLGLACIALPDAAGFPMITPGGTRFFEYKYVVGEALLLVGLVMLIRDLGRRAGDA